MRVSSLLSSNRADFYLTAAGELEVTLLDDREDESWGERISRDDTRELYLRLERVFAPPTRRERRRLRTLEFKIRWLESEIADEEHWLGLWGDHFGVKPSRISEHRERLERLRLYLDGLRSERVGS